MIFLGTACIKSKDTGVGFRLSGRKGSLTHGKETTERAGFANGREGGSRMLDELCQEYHYERKYAIKLLGGERRTQRAQEARPKSAVCRRRADRAHDLAGGRTAPRASAWPRRRTCPCRITSDTTYAN
jgi:hypothetical protein